jgi:hypothetical protein
MPEQATPPQPRQKDFWAITLSGIFEVIKAAVHAIGLPAVLLVLALVVISWFSTDSQKHEIIDKYVLGKNIWEVWPLLLLATLTATFNLSLYVYAKKRIRQKDDELQRCGIEKSQLQQLLSAGPLRHTTPDLED